MKVTEHKKTFKVDDISIDLKRTSGGVMEIWAKDNNSLAKAMGYVHCHDRMMQLFLVRLIGQGRLSECLKADEETLAIDTFMREMGFSYNAKEEVSLLSPEVKSYAQAYCDGINYYLNTEKRCFEFVLTGYKPEPWKIEDTLLIIKLMSYIGLAQTQQDIEKLIIQSIQNNLDIEKLKSLFSPHLDKMTDEQIELIKKTHLHSPTVPKEVKFLDALPKFIASNNWAVSPNKSETGFALQCNDPHLECNRLPAIWYEFVAHVGDNYFMGVNMPGVPGTVMGRNKNISFGFTYGFMDMVDFFIEEVKDGKYRQGEEFIELKTRKDIIKRKKQDPIEIIIRETSSGVLDVDPHNHKLDDGFYFTRAWSGHKEGAYKSLETIYKMHDVSNAKELQPLLANITISCNWLMADKNGDIAYQQSGKLPNRSHSGLFPVEGWIEGNRWNGMHDTDKLANDYNPEKGFIATANQDLNQEGKPLSLNMPMGSYRADRITNLLEQKEKHSIEDMKSIQRDLYSLQAEKFMKLINDFIPNTEVGKVLKNWDLCYDANSIGAVLFEKFYSELLALVFGKGFFGIQAWHTIANETCTTIDFYHVFDEILLNHNENDSPWFNQQSKSDFLKLALENSLKNIDTNKLKNWGEVRQVLMKNIFFDGKLPSFLGFDHGPIALEGNRATAVQGALYNAHGRQSTFCPSYRYITDLGKDNCYTALAGGPSDRRFSKLYTNDIGNWLNYRYKVLQA